MRPVLEVKGVSMYFGGLQALRGVDIDIREREIAALIGPNGAGKTTLFNCITGIYNPSGGQVRLCRPGKGAPISINGKKPHQIARLGMARTFQNIRLFQHMTVLENVMIGRHARTRSGILDSLLKRGATRAEEAAVIEDSFRILENLELARWADVFAGALPYGAQRRLEIARALATEPFLLLLDEPAAGMNHMETVDLERLIRRIRDTEGISILLIEHDMQLVMRISQRIHVMDDGVRIASGDPLFIRNNPAVINAYLGEDGFDAAA